LLLLVLTRVTTPVLKRFAHSISVHAIPVFVIVLRVRTLAGGIVCPHWTLCWIIIVDFQFVYNKNVVLDPDVVVLLIVVIILSEILIIDTRRLGGRIPQILLWQVESQFGVWWLGKMELVINGF
jgi:hypothetical protein